MPASRLCGQPLWRRTMGIAGGPRHLRSRRTPRSSSHAGTWDGPRWGDNGGRQRAKLRGGGAGAPRSTRRERMRPFLPLARAMANMAHLFCWSLIGQVSKERFKKIRSWSRRSGDQCRPSSTDYDRSPHTARAPPQRCPSGRDLHELPSVQSCRPTGSSPEGPVHQWTSPRVGAPVDSDRRRCRRLEYRSTPPHAVWEEFRAIPRCGLRPSGVP